MSTPQVKRDALAKPVLGLVRERAPNTTARNSNSMKPRYSDDRGD